MNTLPSLLSPIRSRRILPLLFASCAALLVAGLLATPLAVGLAQDADTESAAEGPATPKFKDSTIESVFAEGKSLFDEGIWKDAEKKFKACRKQVVKADSKLLKSWLAACKGGTKLASVQKTMAKQSWLKAWSQLEKVEAGYGKTPLRSHLDQLAGEIERELFLVLATFEDPAPEPQKNAGQLPDSAKRVADAKKARRGEGSLRWQESVGLGTGRLIGLLPIAQFEGGTLGACNMLRISIYSESKDFGKFTLLLDNGNLDTSNPLDILKQNIYFHHLTINHVGWKDFRIDLRKEFATLAKPIPEEMIRLSLLLIPPSKPKTIRIDEVKFEKLKK